MDQYTLISCIGKSDPIRGLNDGPMLHIVRNYHPKQVIFLLSEEIKTDEQLCEHNRRAIHMLEPECRISEIDTVIQNVHSFDTLSDVLPSICSKIKRCSSEEKILVNISSGTPQIQAALCMIAISDPEKYIPIQVETPEHSSNKEPYIDAKKNTIEEYMDNNLDNEPDAVSRCREPKLLNFRKPILQFQILSLTNNYDYSGALQLFKSNESIFNEKTGLLLTHVQKRLNLEHKQAVALAKKLNVEKELYPVKGSDASKLIEYYNSMKIKQYRNELNDFALRVEIMALYFGYFLLEKCLGIKKLTDIAVNKGLNGSDKYILSQEKCQKNLPGLEGYLNEKFCENYQWSYPLNARTISYIAEFLISKKEEYARYRECGEELIKWTELTSSVRNPAAHTIIAITDDEIRRAYENKDSKTLCKAMRKVLIQALSNVEKSENVKAAMDIYQHINKMISESMEE